MCFGSLGFLPFPSVLPVGAVHLLHHRQYYRQSTTQATGTTSSDVLDIGTSRPRSRTDRSHTRSSLLDNMASDSFCLLAMSLVCWFASILSFAGILGISKTAPFSAAPRWGLVVGRRGSARPDAVVQLAATTVDATGFATGDYRWIIANIPYGKNESINEVINRGLAAHDTTRNALVSVHLEGEVLSEDNWHGAIDNRQLRMKFETKDAVVVEAEAVNGTLLVKVKALKTKVDALERDSTIKMGRIDALQGEIGALQRDNTIKTGEIVALQRDNTIKTGRIDALQRDNTITRLNIRFSLVQDLVKDFTSQLELADILETSEDLKADFKDLREARNDEAHFMRMGSKQLTKGSELLEYTPSPRYDSRAVLCTKMRMMREFFSQGLPQVHQPAFRSEPVPHAHIQAHQPRFPPPPPHTGTSLDFQYTWQFRDPQL